MTDVVDHQRRTPRRSGFWAALLLTFAAAIHMAPGYAEAKPKAATIIVDAATGTVLYEANSRAKAYPASLTKMMTLYLLFEAIEAKRVKIDGLFKVSAHAAAQPATDIGLTKGEQLTVEKAILALVVHSANDVAVVVAEALGGSEDKFARMMTAKARELGMASTVFRNASGLPDGGQVTTARDMAVLARALIDRFPSFYPYFSVDSFTFDGRSYKSHNRVMQSYTGADGLKTGYTRASGYNLASSATRDGKRIIAVVMGGKTARARDLQMARLLDQGFELLEKQPKQQVAGATLPQSPLATPSATTTQSSITVEPLPPPLKLAAEEIEVASADDAPAATVSTKAAGGKNRWGIQVGAFAAYEPALKAATSASKRVAKLLKGAQVVVEETAKGKSKLYRARVVGLTKQTAQAACRQLKAKSVPCLVFQSNLTLAMNSAQ